MENDAYLIKTGTKIMWPLKNTYCSRCTSNTKSNYCRANDNACDKVYVCMSFFTGGKNAGTAAVLYKQGIKAA